MLDLYCRKGFPLAAVSVGYSLIAVLGLLIAEHRLLGVWASMVTAHGLHSCGYQALGIASIVVAYGLNCSTTCGIFPDQGLNPCLFHWQTESLPLSHRGALWSDFFYQSEWCFIMLIFIPQEKTRSELQRLQDIKCVQVLWMATFPGVMNLHPIDMNCDTHGSPMSGDLLGEYTLSYL